MLQPDPSILLGQWIAPSCNESLVIAVLITFLRIFKTVGVMKTLMGICLSPFCRCLAESRSHELAIVGYH